MKKGHLRLLVFEICFFLILVVNSFIPSILSGYKIIILLVILTILFKFLFGIEKDRHRFVKDIIYELLIMLLAGFLLYYVAGIFFGFMQTPNYYSWFGFKTFIIPAILTIVLKEFLRFEVLTKAEGSKVLLVTSFVIFVLIDLVGSIFFRSFHSATASFYIISMSILPAISSNILATYICIKTGYKPNLVWQLPIKLYGYLLPLVPNTGDYILSVIRILFPVIMLYRLYQFYKKDMDEYVERDYTKSNPFWMIFSTSLVIILVYFTSGYFRFYTLAIGSGSMEPLIHKGDIVIAEKIPDDYELKKGEILVYNYGTLTVVHRLVQIEEDRGTKIYYTQGDANASIDSWQVSRDMVVGIVKVYIPYIGLPVTWLNDLKK